MKLRKILLLSILGILSLSLISCNKSPKYSFAPKVEKKSVIEVNEIATDQLIGNCITYVDNINPIIITSLVNIDNLNLSSTMGRMSSEMIANRLTQHGFKVKEIKMGDNIFVSEDQGEFILSRELMKIALEHEYQGFIVGTYAVDDSQLRKEVFVSLRFVDTNNIVVCSHNYSITNTNIKLWTDEQSNNRRW